jgi:2-hydroxychromene-2-carboxylate isomerase
MEIRWPDQWPANSLLAMRAATFAQQAGRAVAFSLAAFRQEFCAGRDLSELDSVLIAAAACELHPKAVTKGVESKSVKDRLRAATEGAAARGVIGVPTVAVGDELFWGDDQLENAAAAATTRYDITS